MYLDKCSSFGLHRGALWRESRGLRSSLELNAGALCLCRSIFPRKHNHSLLFPALQSFESLCGGRNTTSAVTSIPQHAADLCCLQSRDAVFSRHEQSKNLWWECETSFSKMTRKLMGLMQSQGSSGGGWLVIPASTPCCDN